MTQTPQPDTPNIKVIPPVAFLLALVFGYGMNALCPIDIFKAIPPAIFGLGMVLLCFGGLFGVLGLRLFYRLEVDPHAHTGVDKLVSSGLYKFSRNPMYVGLLAILLGIAFISGNIWLLVAWPGLWLHLRYHVIAREEIYLTRKFGEDYLHYLRNVRRWL